MSIKVFPLLKSVPEQVEVYSFPFAPVSPLVNYAWSPPPLAPFLCLETGPRVRGMCEVSPFNAHLKKFTTSYRLLLEVFQLFNAS